MLYGPCIGATGSHGRPKEGAMMFKPMRAMARDPEGKVLLGSAVLLLTVGTVAYMLLEGWSPLDSLYFCVVTLATIGFGDYVPTNDLAKLFTIGYVITGIGILATFVSELSKYRGETAALRFRRLGKVETEVARDVEDVVDVVEPGKGD
jgi:voltage-gated potassium channel